MQSRQLLCVVAMLLCYHTTYSSTLSSPLHSSYLLEEEPDPFSLNFSSGFSIRYFFHRLGGSNFVASFSVGVNKKFELFKKKRHHFIPAYQFAINMYDNGLGTSLLSTKQKSQIDIVNSIGFTMGVDHKNDDRETPVRIFNYMTAPSVEQSVYVVSSTFMTNFISNFDGRHQQVGSLDLSLWKVLRVGYYNDGEPFHKIGMADSKDRWWTGGGYVELSIDGMIDLVGEPNHDQFYLWYGSLYAAYDRFTGDVSDAQDISKYLLLNYVPTKQFTENFFTQGQTRFGYSHPDGWGANLTFLGQSDKDIQDWIHKQLHTPRHLSLADQSWLIGLDFSDVFYKTQFRAN